MPTHPSRTAANLQSAFAGESMANRKYLYFARIARKLGNEEIALLFEETAGQETGHAFAHLDLLYPEAQMNVEKLLELARRNEETGESFILVRDGKPVSTLLPFDEYESLLETLDILEQDPNILKKLKKAQKEIKAGKYKTWNSPFREKTRGVA